MLERMGTMHLETPLDSMVLISVAFVPKLEHGLQREVYPTHLKEFFQRQTYEAHGHHVVSLFFAILESLVETQLGCITLR